MLPLAIHSLPKLDFTGVALFGRPVYTPTYFAYVALFGLAYNYFTGMAPIMGQSQSTISRYHSYNYFAGMALCGEASLYIYLRC